MENWRLAYAENYKAKDFDICCIADIEKYGLKTIKATVPGNFELDFMREGIIEDLFYSTNVSKAQELENLHLWYYTEFELKDENSYLHFCGIDTIADIYINGSLAKSTDNMFIEYDVYGDYIVGKNELLVHIKPACIEARKYTLPAGATACKYNYDSLYIRKAAHTYGWDIMPRIVSAGIWKDVEIRKIKCEKLCEVFLSTVEFKDDNTAELKAYINVDVNGDFIKDYKIKIKGVCDGHSFATEQTLWHTSFQFCFDVENPKLWWPKNQGEQNLYDVCVEFFCKDRLIDTKEFKFGIRTARLNFTDATDRDGNGEFCFEINGKKIFVLGTNWVPLDAFHSKDKERLDDALRLLDECGCNMVRCWGGNVYETDEFFDFCDRKGIMVWQDFALGCAAYPRERAFFEKIEEEVIFQVKRLRNHTALVLWAGDNECDVALNWIKRVSGDPNDNIISRYFIKNAVLSHDTSRTYLPSSPYISEKAYKEQLIIPEDHLWGPRDYFKGEFYSTAPCHFASETGYHGFPAVKSLKKFLQNPERIFEENYKATEEYYAHATSIETDGQGPYNFRMKLAYDQVVTLFGKAEENFEDFVKQSQISQAEAKKYFIERFRIGKWRRTGIIWWNLLDGWPQVSDAVVDYYFTKKLAYHYITRSQKPVCFMCDEPKDNLVTLCGVNDLPENKEAEYRVTRMSDKKTVLTGRTVLDADKTERIDRFPIKDGEKDFYLIEWVLDGEKYKNHYFTNIIDIDYKYYISCLAECGMDEFDI